MPNSQEWRVWPSDHSEVRAGFYSVVTSQVCNPFGADDLRPLTICSLRPLAVADAVDF